MDEIPWRVLPALLLAWPVGCAGNLESQTYDDFEAVADRRADAGGEARPELDGSLEAYVAYALPNSPELEASFERWRAGVHRIAERRRLPEPTITYAYFVRSVETRVGPQRHRLSLRQTFPWPTRLTAGSDAAALMARAEQRRFEALGLALRQRIADAYWRLWLVRRTHRVLLEQERIVETLVDTVQARVETGEASLADLSQIQLRLERHRDHHGRHREEARALSAELSGLIGAPPGTRTPVDTTTPPGGLPAEEEERLVRSALDHPRVAAHEALAEANDAAARRESAERLPSFVLGVDWIETGEATNAGVDDSGKDPVIVSLGLRLPLWQGSYSDAEDAARAEADAHRSDAEATRLDAQSRVRETLASLRDAERRIRLYQDTLIPQAETVYGAVLGEYQTGRAGIAQVLLAVRDLLDLQIDLASARAEHERVWARLEHVVGRTVDRTEVTHGG